MKATDPRFFENLERMWTRGPIEEPVSIDEHVFDEIYKLQEEKHNDDGTGNEETAEGNQKDLPGMRLG